MPSTVTSAAGGDAGGPADQSPPVTARRLDFRVLGPLEVYAEGTPVPVAGARQRTVLAALLMAGGAVVPVESLVEAVWNGDPPVTGRTQVAICVAGLRKACRATGAGEVLVTETPGYRLATDGHRVDAREFSERVEQAQDAARLRRTEHAVTLFADALALWRGPTLANVDSDVVRAAAARLDEERLSAYEQYLALRLALGRHRALIGELTDLVRERPSWEQARAYLMLAHYRCGRRAEALAVFRQGREYSISELGLEPGPVLREMHTAILRDDPSLAAPAAPEAAPGTAAGTGPGHVVAPEPDVVPAQLPPDEPAFTGREQEVTALDEALLCDRGRYRPLRWGQVLGGAGVGKTALAVHWAHRVAPEFPDGQLYADLRGIDLLREPRTPGSVLEDFIRALGRTVADLPAGTDARAAFYQSLLAERRMLLVLDNVHSFAQLQPLLPGNGACRVVVTAREPLTGPAAARLRLHRLSVEATVALLRAALPDGRVAAEPQAAARLAALCEGLPLAVRTAAARLSGKPHWNVADLVRRLEDPGRRLVELDADGTGVATALALSYRALPPDAAAMFRRLALLDREEVALGHAAALLATGPAAAEDLLERLVDADLVEVAGRDTHGQRRFRLAGLRRLYAHQRVCTDETPDDRAAVCARAVQ